MTRTLLVDLVPVLVFVYLTERRSRDWRGRRIRVERRRPAGRPRAATALRREFWWLWTVGMVALFVAPRHPISRAYYANGAAVLLVVFLVQAVGVFVHNRTPGRR